MLALIQRVTQAEVVVDSRSLGAIGPGLLVFVGVERGDVEATSTRLYERVSGYRVFPDAQDQMNLSVTQAGGQLLLVPQFTLPADTRKGMRPSLSTAAAPAEAERLFEHFVETARAAGQQPQTGRFRSHMQVSLVNDGPVTFMLRVAPPA
jgi:D-tyrosyl-tRNA(Tyr) deacylase